MNLPQDFADLLAEFERSNVRVDLLLSIENLDFEQAWQQRLDVESGNIVVHVLGLQHLLAIKRIAARPQDIADVRVLTRLSSQNK